MSIGARNSRRRPPQQSRPEQFSIGLRRHRRPAREHSLEPSQGTKRPRRRSQLLQTSHGDLFPSVCTGAVITRHLAVTSSKTSDAADTRAYRGGTNDRISFGRTQGRRASLHVDDLSVAEGDHLGALVPRAVFADRPRQADDRFVSHLSELRPHLDPQLAVLLDLKPQDLTGLVGQYQAGVPFHLGWPCGTPRHSASLAKRTANRSESPWFKSPAATWSDQALRKYYAPLTRLRAVGLRRADGRLVPDGRDASVIAPRWAQCRSAHVVVGHSDPVGSRSK
jgi:hypothetical protein